MISFICHPFWNILFLLSLCNFLIFFLNPSKIEPKIFILFFFCCHQLYIFGLQDIVCFLQYLQPTQKNPFVPQRIVSADTKTCQHTSRFILPYCDVAEVFVSRESLFPLTALAALVTFFHFRFMRQGHGLRRNFMLVLIIICRWILSPTVPILYTEK